MNTRTLYLAWQDTKDTRQWFPVGRLDVSDLNYRFHYLQGAKRAHEDCGFEALYDFPDFHKDYNSTSLFPFFENRVLTPGRRDFQDYLQHAGFTSPTDPIEILAVTGGSRVTDSFEVFPAIVRRGDGLFNCRFFVHGIRHTNVHSQERVVKLKGDEDLLLSIEITNPVTRIAIQLQTDDHYVIGWTPRYLVDDLVHVIGKDPEIYRAKVVRVNPPPAPAQQRILVELTCKWPTEYKPMSKNDFVLLTA